MSDMVHCTMGVSLYGPPTCLEPVLPETGCMAMCRKHWLEKKAVDAGLALVRNPEHRHG